jgi:hypothetical protein
VTIQLTAVFLSGLMLAWFVLPMSGSPAPKRSVACEGDFPKAEFGLQFCHERELATFVANWDRQPDARAFFASGFVTYEPHPCRDNSKADLSVREMRIGTRLDREATSFAFPAPEEPSRYFVKEFQFRLRVLNSRLQTLGKFENGMVGEPPICATPVLGR